MTSYLALSVLFVSINMMMVGASNQFKVGDAQGWREPNANDTGLYNKWAAGIRFEVGDSIYFEYKEDDSVLVVDKRGYYHCNTTKPLTEFHEGRTVFELDKPGPYYFISGAPDRCKKGQRLIVDVLAPHQPHPSFPPQPSVVPYAPSPSPQPSSAISPSVSALTTLLAFTIVGALLMEFPWSE